MTGRFAGLTAVVTGAGRGIGAAVASRLAAEGARVACLDIDSTASAATARAIGGRAIAVATDIANEADVAAAVDRVTAAGGIDVLVNNAGIAGPQYAARDTPVEDWDHTLAVNLRGTFLMVKHALPSLLERGGNIVNIASALALVGWRQESAYGASKAAVVQFTKSVALDYAPRVRANCVCPGAVRTPMITSVLEGSPDMEKALADYGQIHPLHRRLAWPEEIADAVLFLASADASFITGAVLPVDGGFTAS